MASTSLRGSARSRREQEVVGLRETQVLFRDAQVVGVQCLVARVEDVEGLAKFTENFEVFDNLRVLRFLKALEADVGCRRVVKNEHAIRK